MRLILDLLYAVFGVIFSLPMHLYFKSLAKKDLKKSWIKSNKYVRGFFKGLLFLSGTKVEVRGLENVPQDTACLFVGNHRSYFDIIALHSTVNRPLGFISKIEFSKTPLLPLYMLDMGCIFIDRDNAREGLKTINQGIEYMKQGLSLCLFPEGTRNHSDELLPFKEGGYRMADKSKSPIVITAMSGMDDIFEKNKFYFVKKRHVIIEFDKPVYPSELKGDDKKQFYASIPERIQELRSNHVL